LLLVDRLVGAAKDVGLKTIPELSRAAKAGKLSYPLLFGGNTTCTEVRQKNESLFVDMGSGMREAGAAFMKSKTRDFNVLITHMHWDHLMGLPFFVPIYIPGTRVRIYHTHRNAEDFVKILFNGINFPIKWDGDQIKARFEFIQLKLYKPEKIGRFTVTPFNLDHPGGSFGYRIEGGGKSVAVGVDGEFRRNSRADLGKDLRFYQNLDLLIFDSQYDYDELAAHFDWGHCTPRIGIDIALREGIKNLAFTHHDPSSDDNKLIRMYEDSQTYTKSQLSQYREVWRKNKQPKGPHLHYCYDGMQIELK